MAPTNKEIGGTEPRGTVFGCDYHPVSQQITWLDTDAGEVVAGAVIATKPKNFDRDPKYGQDGACGMETSRRHEVCPLRSAPVRLHPDAPTVELYLLAVPKLESAS